MEAVNAELIYALCGQAYVNLKAYLLIKDVGLLIELKKRMKTRELLSSLSHKKQQQQSEN